MAHDYEQFLPTYRARIREKKNQLCHIFCRGSLTVLYGEAGFVVQLIYLLT